MDFSGGRKSAGPPQTTHLPRLHQPYLFLLQHFLYLKRNLPIALNSNLTNPANVPFSNTTTLSVTLPFPFTLALNADPSASYASPLVSTPGATAEIGTQNCGKYLCSQTHFAFVASKSQMPSKRARTRRGVDSTLWGPEATRLVVRVWRLGFYQPGGLKYRRGAYSAILEIL
jgi:hypothetical protein